jgi:hypothetical protein
VVLREADSRARRSLTAARAIVSGTAAVAMLAVQLTVRGKTISVANFGVAVITTAWWLAPLLYYWFRVATAAGAWLLGSAFIAASAWLLVSMYSSDSSTAALGFLALPTLLWAGMLMGVDVDRVLARWGLLRHQLGAGPGEWLSSAGSRLGRRVPAWWQWMLPTGAVLLFVSFFWWNIYGILTAVLWSAIGAAVAIIMRRKSQA